MIETSIWCTKAETRMSSDVVVTRGDERYREGSKRRRELTVINDEPRRSSSSIAAAWRREVVRAAWEIEAEAGV